MGGNHLIQIQYRKVIFQPRGQQEVLKSKIPSDAASTGTRYRPVIDGKEKGPGQCSASTGCCTALAAALHCLLQLCGGEAFPPRQDQVHQHTGQCYTQMLFTPETLLQHSDLQCNHSQVQMWHFLNSVLASLS